jgi:hypothetical protein
MAMQIQTVVAQAFKAGRKVRLAGALQEWDRL